MFQRKKEDGSDKKKKEKKKKKKKDKVRCNNVWAFLWSALSVP